MFDSSEIADGISHALRRVTFGCACVMLLHGAGRNAHGQGAELLMTPGLRDVLEESAATAAGRNRPQDVPSLSITPITGIPAKTAARPGILVLVDGRVVSGAISEVPSGYQLTRPGGASETVPAFLVRVSADSLEQAYEKLRDSQRAARPDDHISLAEWCMSQGLDDFARDELAEALKLDSRRRDARALLMKLEAKLHREPRHLESQPAEERTNGFENQSPVTTADLSGETRADFVRKIQPLIMNKCNNIRCHGVKGASSLELITVRSDSTSRVATHENLMRIVDRLDTSSPDSSPLLQALTSETHCRVFIGRTGNLQLNSLRDWVSRASLDLASAGGNVGDSMVTTAGLSLPDRVRSPSVASPALRSVDRPPVLQPTPQEALLNDVLLEERPDPFDPDAFNREMHPDAESRF